MDDAIKRAQERSHFWLRYAQQFTVGARTHTIEMGIPIPVGATPDERTRLIQEAEAGLKQIEAHIERRVTQMQQRSAPQPGAPTSTPASRPPGQPASRPPAQSAAAPSSSPAHILNRDPREAPNAAPSSGNRPTQPHTPQEATSRQETVPPPRPPARLNLPSTPGPMRNEGSNLKIAEFLNIVRDNFKLDSTEAMALLHVKSLADINLNEALKRLRHIIEQNNHAAPPPNQVPDNRTSSQPDEKPAPASRPGSITTAQTTPVPAVQAPSSARKVADGGSRAAVPAREVQAGYGFDEEEGQDEDDDLDFEEEDDDPEGQGGEMTAQEEARGKQLLSDLRGVRGTKPASESRLGVLMNIVSSQIDEDDLLRLVRALWGVSYLTQLKVDQVEKLISWGKEDYFEDDVQLVLALI